MDALTAGLLVVSLISIGALVFFLSLVGLLFYYKKVDFAGEKAEVVKAEPEHLKDASEIILDQHISDIYKGKTKGLKNTFSPDVDVDKILEPMGETETGQEKYNRLANTWGITDDERQD